MTVNLTNLGSAVLVWACLQPCLTLACRYNVRDVGFVDLETEPYRLYGFVHSNTPADTVSLLQERSAAALRESNISVEIVNVDRQTNHPALKHLPAGSVDTLPVAVLVSPDGQSLPLALSAPGQSLRETLTAALRELVSSPTREQTLRTVSQAFGAVLLIEGGNAMENGRARNAITNALGQIRTQMKGMPKTIAEPPAMIVLDMASYAREKILLWSLGLDTATKSQPRAAVLYGKARWIGPLMKGEEITERNLTGILSIIGADCECGLDISWTQGTRLPVRWDETLQAQVAKALGFDPESPMVKTEVSRIIRRPGSSTATSSGYQEVALAAEPRSTAGESSGASASSRAPAATQRAGPAPTTPALADSGPIWHRSVLFMAGLAALIVAAGLFILLRAARNKREHRQAD
jgi:hypothetical protein